MSQSINLLPIQIYQYLLKEGGRSVEEMASHFVSETAEIEGHLDELLKNGFITEPTPGVYSAMAFLIPGGHQ